jgi:hypothetical protein
MKPENFGQLIADCGTITQYDENFPLIHYISGIKEFDEAFGNKPFSETNFCHSIMFCENAIIFYIFKKDTTIRAAYPKSSLTKVTPDNDAKIKIRNINSISKTIKFGGGLAGAVIGAASDKLTDKFSGITSKEVDGIVYDLTFVDENNVEKTIKVGCQKEYASKVALFFSQRHSTKPLDESSSSSCYIATVCYGNNMAPEVIKFREFRDNHLKNNYLGKKFITLYYNNAESISKKLEKKPLVNKVIKSVILTPIYKLIK